MTDPLMAFVVIVAALFAGAVLDRLALRMGQRRHVQARLEFYCGRHSWTASDNLDIEHMADLPRGARWWEELRPIDMAGGGD